MVMDRKSELLVRVYIVFFVFVVLAVVILSKVITISLFEGEKWRERGGRNVKWIEVNGERGNIYDSRGNLLATSLPYFDIYVDAVTISEDLFRNQLKALCDKLALMFGKTPDYWSSKLKDARKSKNRYLSIARNLSKEELETVKSFPIFREGRYKGGILYETHTSREKPYQELASRTIGLDRTNASKIGLEESFDKTLSGEKQRRLMQRYPGNQWLPIYDPAYADQKRGADIVTTLDMNYQDIVHHELLDVVRRYNAKAGTAILMEVKTGAIKAISNLGQASDGSYSEDYNYAIGRLSEPGSTFKLISAMAILESGEIDLDSRIALSGGKKKFYDRLMYDSDQHGKSVVSFKEAFEMSSNVGMATAAFSVFGQNRLEWIKFYESIQKMGAMESTAIEIHGEPDPFFKNPSHETADKASRWSGTTVPWMAHGYELQMTPLQILNVYNAVANNGAMMKPFIVNEIIEPGRKIRRVQPRIVKQKIADADVIVKAQQLLKAVAESGTAKKFEITNTSFAGKTGTTRINYWQTKDVKEYNASFAGYFPADDPKYSLIVVIYNPKGAYYGSQVAGPVFSQIAQRVSGMEERYLAQAEEKPKVAKAHSGYKPDYKQLLEFIGIDYSNNARSNWVEMSDRNDQMAFSSKRIKTTVVPDVYGMGVRDAVYVLESLGMKVKVHGMGRVYRQSIKPGTAIKEQEIIIYLQ